MLDGAEEHLAVVANFARISGGKWDRARVVGESPWPDLVTAYLDTWNSAEAARAVGVRQSTAWGRLGRSGPVVLAIRDRPSLLSTRPRRSEGGRAS
jgi:hypothetical protein